MNNLSLLRWAGGNEEKLDRYRTYLQANIQIVDGHWIWQRARQGSRGYGAFYMGPHPSGRGGVSMAAHRAAYELYKGEIPDGLQLDHLCRNVLCVNPDHLEPVSCRTNLLRGETLAAKNAAKTTCPQGHKYRVYPNGRRRCSVCELAQERIRRPGHHY